jgi:hypothetical protein
MPVQLDSIVPWGRSFDEYVRMFALTEDDLRRSILDCAAGPSSFNAEMHAHGRRAISIDPIYQFTPEQIRSRVQAVRDTMIDQVRGQPEQFVWNYIRSPDHLAQIRLGAMEQFLADFSLDQRDRYLPIALPQIPDGQFNLALCSHFLFLYSDRLDATFHVDAIRSILRAADELRIFPIMDLSGNTSAHLREVQRAFPTQLVRVDYEFLRGANQMAVIRRPKESD